MNIHQFFADEFLEGHNHLNVVLCRSQSMDLGVGTIVPTTPILVGYQPSRAHNLHAVPHYERKLPKLARIV